MTDLQVILSSGSCQPYNGTTHHPITCKENLVFGEDNSLSCPHDTVTADDVRLNNCICHSIAVLIFQCLERSEYGSPERPEVQRMRRGPMDCRG